MRDRRVRDRADSLSECFSRLLAEMNDQEVNFSVVRRRQRAVNVSMIDRDAEEATESSAFEKA